MQTRKIKIDFQWRFESNDVGQYFGVIQYLEGQLLGELHPLFLALRILNQGMR
jgi:hypothetical protein